MYDICIYGNPKLRLKAKPVTLFDSAFEEFAEVLTEKMYEYDGIGLAAPQIGISQRVIVVDLSAESNQPAIFVNPEITWSSDELSSDDEGCLSVPHIRGIVERPASISLKAQKVHRIHSKSTNIFCGKAKGFVVVKNDNRSLVNHHFVHLSV